MPYAWPKAVGVLFAAALLNGSAQAVGVLNASVADGRLAVAAIPVGDGGSSYNALTKPQVKSRKPVGSGGQTLGATAAPSTQAGRISRPPPPTIASPPRPPSLGSYQPPPPSGFQAPNLGGYQPPPPTGYQPPNLGGYQPPPPTGLQPPSLGGFQPPSWPRDQHTLPAPAASGTATPGTVAGPPPPSVAGGAASTCYGPTASPSGCSVQSPVISGTPATNVMIGGPQSNGELLHPAPPPPQGSPPLPPGTDVCRARPDLCLAPAPRSNVAGGNANVGGTTGSAPAGGGGQTTVVVREEYGSPGPAIGVVIGVPTVEYVPQPVPVYPDPPPGAYSENQAIYGQPPPATAAAAPAAPAVVDPFVEVIARLKRLDAMRRDKLITADDHRGQRQAILAALDAGQVSRTVGIEYGLRRLKDMSDDGTINAKEYEEKRKEFVLFL